MFFKPSCSPLEDRLFSPSGWCPALGKSPLTGLQSHIPTTAVPCALKVLLRALPTPFAFGPLVFGGGFASPP